MCSGTSLLKFTLAVLLGVVPAWTALAAEKPAASEKPAGSSLSHSAVVAKGVAYLKGKGQAADGSFTAAGGPGITALVLTSLLRSGVSPDDPAVLNGFKYLDKFVQPDGGLGEPESLYRNYETCLGLMAYSEANADGRFTARIKKADAFVRGLQWDEAEGADKTNPAFGGGGYGKSKRPDLSNTSFLVDALKAAGAGPNDEAIQRALVFVSRTQNLESEHNTTSFAAKVNDGGFYYTPAAGGNSQAGPTEGGGLRSYASMTYAGLKSMVYAGLKADDPRVKAATTWLQKNYDLKNNPGLGQQGLYYYYLTFGKCLHALGNDHFTDHQGKQHDWRAELVAELASRQRDDGSWANENDRWMEGDPNLVTGYALLALSYAKPGAK